MYAIAVKKKKKEALVDGACVKELVCMALHIPLMISKTSDYSRSTLLLSLLDIRGQTTLQWKNEASLISV